MPFSSDFSLRLPFSFSLSSIPHYAIILQCIAINSSNYCTFSLGDMKFGLLADSVYVVQSLHFSRFCKILDDLCKSIYIFIIHDMVWRVVHLHNWHYKQFFGAHKRSSRLALANNYDHCPVLHAFPCRLGFTSRKLFMERNLFHFRSIVFDLNVCWCEKCLHISNFFPFLFFKALSFVYTRHISNLELCQTTKKRIICSQLLLFSIFGICFGIYKINNHSLHAMILRAC